MKLVLIVGGPLILAIAFCVWSGIIVFGDVDSLEHEAGAPKGGTLGLVEKKETYQCDENGNNCVLIDESTSFSEASGLDLEIEQEPIDYREGNEPTTVRKLNGLTKYANITLRWPIGFDTGNWKFVFDESGLPQEEPTTKLDPVLSENPDEGVEMIQIDPPTLVIPAN